MSSRPFEMVYSSKSGFSLKELEGSRPLEDFEVKVLPKWVGVCGSDLHALDIYEGDELRLGHEWVGVVDSIGPKVKSFNPGDYVTSTPLLSCGQCKHCHEGKTNLCESLEVLGSDSLGAIRSQITLPEHCLLKVPNNLDSAAALIEVFSVGEHAADEIEPNLKKDAPILIFGGGAIGQACGLSLKERGHECLILEIFKERIKRCEKLGLSVLPLTLALADPSLKHSFYNMMDCSGDNGEGKGAWQYLSHFGAKSFFALMLAKYSGEVAMSPNLLGERNATLKWMRGTPQSAIDKACKVWSERLSELEKIMVSHIIPVKEVSKAFELAKDKRASGKVLIKI